MMPVKHTMQQCRVNHSIAVSENVSLNDCSRNNALFVAHFERSIHSARVNLVDDRPDAIHGYLTLSISLSPYLKYTLPTRMRVVDEDEGAGIA